MMNLTNFLTRTRAIPLLILALLPGAYSVSCYAQQQGNFIPLPEYSTLDAFGVNVSGNTVAPTVKTLAIGGEMGLSHSITLQGNVFSVDYSEHGFRDKFAGGIRYLYLGRKQLTVNGAPYNDLWVLNASAMGDSAQFVEMCNGSFTNGATSCSTPIYYEAVKDKRNTLAANGGYIVWTKPDGTQVYFEGSLLSNATNGNFTKIIYPNGFTINVNFFTVTTNTGYELKYDYVPDNRGVDKSGITYLGGYTVSSTWWLSNPKAILAINNVYDYCPNQKDPCPTSSLTKTWPTVNFDWPGGMPRTFFIGDSVFRVTDPTGAIAEFTYRAQDTKVRSEEPANTKMAPRLIAIKPFGATQPTVNYTYTNLVHITDVPGFGSFGYSDPAEPGVLNTASGIAGTSGYATYPLIDNHGKGYRGYKLLVEMDESHPTRLEKVVAADRTIKFDQLNTAEQVTTDTSGLSSKTYTYYFNNNVTTNNVQTVTDLATGTSTATGYTTCTDTNRNTCNKPTAVNTNGNVTNYTYHTLSGQIETVTLPANKNGKRAQTRFEYTPMQASYWAGGSSKTLGTSIYLKTAEKYCMNGNFNGSGNGNSVFTGSCELGANDEVVTRYDYDINNNLRLRGKTVTAVNTAGVQTVKRTCYQYDIYNNLIGETQPNANPASCN